MAANPSSRMFSRLAAAATLLALTAHSLHAYALTGSHWYSSPITMQLQLGPNATPLTDGSASWNASAQDALSIWNTVIGSAQFSAVPNSTAPIAEGNGLNNVFFSSDVYGQAWGTGVLAVTLTYTSGGSQTAECDVLFNKTLTWDSYRGPQQYTATGAVYDFHRVALHEFGHVLGLDHPDQAGQTVVAIMNSHISDLDTLAPDDIAGVQSLYGPNPAAASSTPPAAPPTITTPPASQTVVAGSTVSFSATASGSGTLSYQWLKNGGALTGATAATLTLYNVTTGAGGQYAVVVSNSAGSTTSAAATLTVTTPLAPPSITTQPLSQTITAGTGVTFNVAASGSSPLAYTWRKNGVALSGATQAAYTISSAQSGDAGNYSVVVSNSAGSATSATATLTVNAPQVAPSITTVPAAQTVSVGGSITLSVAATGSPAPTYQWQKNGVNIAGATQPSFTIGSAAATDAGTYDVVVTNAAGMVTTVPVLVTVNSSQIINISTRGYVPAGGALTAGFVLRGTSGKPVIVRGVGPALADFGVSNTLAAPQLALVTQQSSQTLAVNSSWGGSTQLATAFQSVGAFPLPAGSADSASELSLMPGSYSTRVTSGTSTGGIALAEVYDANASNVATRLVNVSTLGYTGTGEQALVAGFTVQGNAPKRVLIRAVGPGLAAYNVTGLLADPQLQVYPLGQSTPIASNDNWSDTAEMEAAFATTGAFPLTTGSRDAALVLSLAPGGYTVTITGVGSTTGNVLVEIYDLDP